VVTAKQRETPSIIKAAAEAVDALEGPISVRNYAEFDAYRMHLLENLCLSAFIYR
jgi:hypothetical protein